MYIPIRKTYSYVCYVFTGECYSKWQETSRNCALKAEHQLLYEKNIRLRFCLPEKSNAEIAWYFVYTTCWCLTQGPSNAPANHPTRYHREDTVWLGLTHLLPVCGKKLQSKSCANNLHAEIYRKSWHFFNWGIYIYIILGVVSGDFCFSCFSATFNH